MGKILELINISKYFGAVTALSGISIQFNKGEIHTLLGKNGAGKSTIIKTICGEINPDEGQIIINGKEVKQNTPLLARENGIAVVHQELVVFDNMTVYENIFPYPVAFTKCHAIDKKEHIRRAEELINKFDIKISPVSKMGDLKLSSQQMVEILRALCQNAKIILLDEPTSGLNTQETRLLMDTIKSLRDDGITIIYISHRINEVLEISDTITIMRDGKKIDTIKNIPGLTENELVAKMVGRDFSGSIYSKKNYSDISDREVIFRAEGFSKKGVLNDCSISLRKGEIVGVFGLEGSGTNNFSRMM